MTGIAAGLSFAHPPMSELTTRSVGPVSILALSGRFDASAAPAARKTVEGLLAAGHARLLFDLSAVEFMDSSGLSVIVSALRAAKQAGGEIAVLRPSAIVQSLLEMTRLHRVLAIHDDEDAAVRALSP